jgi:hypothetical protein
VFKRFFGKKNDGFFAVAEDEKVPQQPAAKAPAKSEPVAAPAPVAVAAVEAAPAAKTDKKADEKAAKKAAKVDKKSVKKAEAPKIEAAPAPVAAPVPAAPAITNFATDYLIKPSSISSRRLPGANMKGFLDLARQVEKPKAFKASASERK